MLIDLHMIKLSLYSWTEANLIDLSNVLLNSICEYFIYKFCIPTQQGNWYIVLFYCCSFFQFWYQTNAGYRMSLKMVLPFLFSRIVSEALALAFLKVW
jgi:hypothetical protein